MPSTSLILICVGLLDNLTGTLLTGALAGFPDLFPWTSFGTACPTPERRNYIKPVQIPGAKMCVFSTSDALLPNLTTSHTNKGKWREGRNHYSNPKQGEVCKGRQRRRKEGGGGGVFERLYYLCAFDKVCDHPHSRLPFSFSGSCPVSRRSAYLYSGLRLVCLL